MDGSEVPFSHLLTACLLTPRDSATNSCVILHLVRFSLIISPRVWHTFCFSSRTGFVLKYYFKALTNKINKYTTATQMIPQISKLIIIKIVDKYILLTSWKKHSTGRQLLPPTISQLQVDRLFLFSKQANNSPACGYCLHQKKEIIKNPCPKT